MLSDNLADPLTEPLTRELERSTTNDKGLKIEIKAPMMVSQLRGSKILLPKLSG